MTNIREKLIGLVVNAHSADNTSKNTLEHLAYIADHLIANGVTVQRWIPVAERLPEKTGYYLIWQNGWDKERETYIGLYNDVSRQWQIIESDWSYPCSKVTHWMPLPEPPKGE